ncbi:cuticle protein 76 isoform X1 [Cephus cinctus]|uniref:Cuticle protein 76 isoform X1 n=1 Tax=Cephus cinctus TaxID=211228 RepID=A0AAJ7FHL0_CEPCN|nr:cuticle protein 76 isoform X1 [Cephus cinctus]
MFRLVLICGCLLAVAQAGVIGGGLIATAPTAVAIQPAAAVALPTVATSSSNIIRGIGNLGAISAYSKSVDTAFSSERKADVRVNNPGVTRIVTAATAPALAVTNTALAGPLTTAFAGQALAGPGLTTATVAAAPAITTGLAGPTITTNAIGLNGLGVNGLGLNGISVNGVGLNGVGLNGVALNGLGLGTIRVL